MFSQQITQYMNVSVRMMIVQDTMGGRGLDL